MQLAEPWYLIVPPTIGNMLDLKARDSKWYVLRGFDSKEQCEFGFEFMREQISREAPNYPDYRAMPHGKCIPAQTR